VGALQHGLKASFSDTQISILLGICKKVHTAAISERQSLQTAVMHCHQCLLAHSMDRPPRSVGIFSLEDMRSVSDWFASTYFMHYSLYQYVLNPQVVLSFKSKCPHDALEKPPILPPLQQAAGEAEHAEMMATAQDAEAQTKAKQLAQV
jgi:hypothetical protein